MAQIASIETVVGVIVVYMIAIAIIGYYGWKRTGLTPEDYYLGNRGLGVIVLTGTILATWFSTFAFLGGPGFYYANGTGWLWFGLFNITGPLLIWVFGTRLWLVGKRFGHITPSDLLADYYEGDDVIRILVAIIGISALIPYATIQLSGVGKALVGLTGGEAPFWVGVFVLVAMVAAYIYVGGLRAVAWTDVLQGAIFFVFLVFSAYLAINWAGGIGPGFERAIEVDPAKWSYGGVSPGGWLTGALIWGAAWVFIPHMWQRMFMAEDPRVLAQTAVISGTLSLWIITFMGLIFGGLASGLMPSLPSGQSADAILPIMYSEFFAAGGVLIVVAAYAAAMSTMGSQILTSSSLFVRDIAKKPFRPEMDEETESRIGRYFIIVFAAIALGLALSPVGRRAIIPLASDGVALALLFVPLVIGIFFWDEASRVGARWSLIIGFVFMQVAIWTPFGDLLPYFGPAAWGLALASLVFYTVSKATDPVSKDIQKRYDEVLSTGMRIDRVHEPASVEPADD